MRVALVQLNSSDDPVRNLSETLGLLEQAAEAGAELIATPEVTNCVSLSRAHQRDVLQAEADDMTLAACRAFARDRRVWLLLGSLALKGGADGRFVNRSFLIAGDGGIRARYDKIHMFDVAVTPSETFRESDGYAPGDDAVLADTPWGKLGMTICYDMRFPGQFRDLAKAGADILCCPSAFSPVTGAAHWEVLLRARAIESGCYVLAPAQCGTHFATRGKPRQTYGHSLAVDPWGQVLADGGTEPGMTIVTLDLAAVKAARARIPSLTHDRPYGAP